MGCQASKEKGEFRRKKLKKLGELAVFFPSLRVPKFLSLEDFKVLLSLGVPTFLIEKLCVLRSKISTMAALEASSCMKPISRTKFQGLGSSQEELLRILEEYLAVLIGLVKDGNGSEDKIAFTWVNQMDDKEETTIANAWYEVLSVLHLMSMLCLSQANRLLLLSRKTAHSFHQKIIEVENRRISVDLFLKAAGYLDFSINHVLPHLNNFREDIPLDIEEGMLRALCQQTLGQGVGIQLEMAIDSPKATLAVKRRFGCEMVTYWKEALNSLKQTPTSNDMGTKYELYIKWKYIEAKAAAYYYHGLILKEGSETKSHRMAVAALQAADWFLRDSRRACETFNSAFPKSRTPPPLASMKSLVEKIMKDTPLSRNPQKRPEIVPLPDFAPALIPDEYQLPQLDNAWDKCRQS